MTIRGKDEPGATGGGVLRELQAAAAVKRAARRRLADATAEYGPAALELQPHRDAHDTTTTRWVNLLRQAAAAGHPTADIARAAGVAPSSILYRLSDQPD